MSDHHPGHLTLFDELERDVAKAREYLTAQFSAHHLWKTLMSALDDLIANGRALKAERAALLTDRDAQKARADKAEASAASLQAQIDADDQKAKAAADDLQAEVDAEAAPVVPVDTTTVTAPVAAGSTTISVDTAPTIGSTVSGAAVAPGTTVTDVTAASDGSATVTLSQPTTDDHTGGEQLVVAPAA